MSEFGKHLDKMTDEEVARFFAWIMRTGEKKPEPFYVQCPCCNGDGYVGQVFGAKDDEVRE